MVAHTSHIIDLLYEFHAMLDRRHSPSTINKQQPSFTVPPEPKLSLYSVHIITTVIWKRWKLVTYLEQFVFEFNAFKWQHYQWVCSSQLVTGQCSLNCLCSLLL